MEIKPGYKQTEIGVIPEDWVVIQLGKVIHKMQLGGNYANSEAATGPPLIKMGNIGRGMIVLDRLEYIRDTDKQRDEDILCAGDVIFNTRNTLDLVGKVAIWRNELPLAYFNSNIMKITFDGKYIASNEYANYVLNSRHTISRLRDIATGTTSVAAIYTRDLLKIDLLISPTNEQIKIARCLTDIDSLITSLEKLIEKKKLIKKGVMQELLTGKGRLPGFSGEWETKRLGDSLVFERPDKYIYWGKELKPQGSIPVLTANKSFILGYANEYVGVFNDVPAIIFDDFTTDCKYVRFAFKVKSSAIKILKPANREIDLRFIYYTMQSIKFSIGDHKRYYISEYQHLKIRVPKINEQEAIADVIENIEFAIDLLEKHLNKQVLIKQAMMQELLTGRIRLI